MKTKVGLRGFYRVKIGEDLPDGGKKIIGDSGWMENMVVNLGVQNYILRWLCSVDTTAQIRISHVGLGTGNAPASNDTSLSGETGARKTVSPSIVSNRTGQFTAEWASGDHPGGTPALKNAGLFNTSSGGTIFSGATFAISTWQSNQGVSVTYQVQFPTS